MDYFLDNSNFNYKVLSKFDVTLAEEVLKWMAVTLEEEFDTNGEMTNFGDQLKDGQKLCRYTLKYYSSSLSVLQYSRIYQI